jgi:hypothetical protein
MQDCKRALIFQDRDGIGCKRPVFSIDQFGWTSSILAAPVFFSQMTNTDAHEPYLCEISDDSGSMEFIDFMIGDFFDAWKLLLGDILHASKFQIVK